MTYLTTKQGEKKKDHQTDELLLKCDMIFGLLIFKDLISVAVSVMLPANPFFFCLLTVFETLYLPVFYTKQINLCYY